MDTFPNEAPWSRVVSALGRSGFRQVRERENISMVRQNADGTRTPLTLPNHPHLKGSTLRAMCTQAGIPRDDFLKVYDET